VVAITSSLPALAFQSAAPATTPACWTALAMASGSSASGVQGSNATAGPPAAGAWPQPAAAMAGTARARSRRENGEARLELRATGKRDRTGPADGGSDKSELSQQKNAEKHLSAEEVAPGLNEKRVLVPAAAMTSF
jgi:hypothetical protein